MRTKENVITGTYSYNMDGQIQVQDEGKFFQVRLEISRLIDREGDHK